VLEKGRGNARKTRSRKDVCTVRLVLEKNRRKSPRPGKRTQERVGAGKGAVFRKKGGQRWGGKEV